MFVQRDALLLQLAGNKGGRDFGIWRDIVQQNKLLDAIFEMQYCIQRTSSNCRTSVPGALIFRGLFDGVG